MICAIRVVVLAIFVSVPAGAPTIAASRYVRSPPQGGDFGDFSIDISARDRRGATPRESMATDDDGARD